MKRGLVKLDINETPQSAYENRLDQLRAQLKDQGCTIGLVYADISRGGDLSYLTNFCLYWNEAVLAVPVDGPPALIMKLSKRVNPWIKRTTILDDIRSGPNAAKNIAEFINEQNGGANAVVGIVGDEWWPDALLTQLRDAAPGAELRPLGDLVKVARRVPDLEELALLEEAGKILTDVIEKAAQKAEDGARLSLMVGDGRRAGYADLEVHCRTADTGDRLIDAWGQYRYVWVEAARTEGGAAGETLQRARDVLFSALKPGVSESSLQEAVAKALPGKTDLTVSCWSHVDIETRGAYRPAEDTHRAFAEGEVVSPRLTLKTPDGVFTSAATVRVLTGSPSIIAAQLKKESRMTLKAQSTIAAPPLEEREWRYNRIRKEMEKAGLDGLLIYAPSWRRENFRYVTGAAIQSSVALAYLPATGAPTAFVLSAEDERATKAAGFVEDIRRVTLATPAEIADRLREGGAPEKIGVAGWDFLPASLLAGLKDAAPGAEFVNGTMIGDKVRLVKSDWEIQKLRRAGEICDAAWLAFLEAIVPGAHEFDIVANVEAKLRSMGGADNFMLIASGGDDVRGMTPPTDRKLEKGDMVRTELTPQWDGYWTQICRSAVMGPASDAQKKSFDLFNESVAAGIDVIKPGVTAHDIAKAENDVFRKYGYGEYCTAEYTRVRGHCLGLYLDEVLILEGVETVLEENSVLIVHPNTYTPIAGYHVLGDSVVVTKNGAEKLFKTPRQLDEVPVQRKPAFSAHCQRTRRN